MEESATAKELRELECDMALAFGWSEHVGPYLPMPTPTSIRLLEVAPGQPFRLSFKIVNLDDLPVYSVLSYTWGNPRGILPSGEDVEADRIAMLAKYPVNCENCVLEVSANCYEFLKWFQTFQQAVCAGWEGVRVFNVSSKHVRYIWVDAICINQHSTKDKNCQVRIMDRVYRQAGKALIWLGAADELTQEGLTTMISFATAAHALRAHKIPKESRSRLIGRPGNSPLLAKLRLPRLGPRQWQAVLSMYRRTWFSRAWTVQEFALAKGSIVVCGDWMNVWSLWSESSFFLMESDWAMILTKMETRKAHNESTIARLKYDGLLGDCPPGQSVTILYDVKDSFFFPLICLRDISYIQREISRQRWTFSKLTFPLQRMLGTLSHSNSSHPADHIYAFLGLVPASSWEGLSIDYNRPTADTFVQTTWAMIKSTKTLSILSFSELKLMGGVKDLPTWVPDYTTRQVMKPLDPGSSFPFAGNPPGYFNASKKSLYNSPIKDTLSRTLIVSGYHQCIIAEVEKRNPLRSPDITEKHEPSKLPSIDWKDVFRFDQSLSMLRCAQRLPQDHFWRTLISNEDIWDTTFPASPRSARYIFQSWMNALSHRMRRIDAMYRMTSITAIDIDWEKISLRRVFMSYVVLCRDRQYPEANTAIDNDLKGYPSYGTTCQYIRRGCAGSDYINSVLEKKDLADVAADMNRVRHSIS